MTDFISDEEMAQIEAQAPMEQGFDFLSDEDMAFQEQLEREQVKIEKIKEKRKPGMVRSIAGGIAQGVTLGFADEIEAGIESALTEKNYDQILAETRQRYKEEQEANPVAFGLGEFGSSIVPGAGIAKLAGTTIKGAMAGGGAIGGIQAAGTTEEKITESPLEFAKDVAIGTGVGAVIGGAVPLAKAGYSKLSAGVTDIPEKIADKITSARLKKATELRGESLHKTSKELQLELKNPKVKARFNDMIEVAENDNLFGTSIKESLDRVQSLKKHVGKKLGDDYGKAKDPEFHKYLKDSRLTMKTEIDKAEADLVTELLSKGESGLYSNREVDRAIKGIKESFKKINLLSLKEDSHALSAAREIRQGLSKRLKSPDFLPGGTKAGAPKDVLKLQISKIRELESNMLKSLETGLEAQSPLFEPKVLNRLSAKLSDYEPAMKRYSTLSDLEDILVKTEAKADSKFNQTLLYGLGADLVLPGAGLGVGGIAMAREYLNSTSGKLRLAKILRGSSSAKSAKMNKLVDDLNITKENFLDILEKTGIARGSIGKISGILSAKSGSRQLTEEEEE